MSAAEKLRALPGFTCENWIDMDASDLGVTQEIIAVVAAAEDTVRNAQLVCDEEILLARALSSLEAEIDARC